MMTMAEKNVLIVLLADAPVSRLRQLVAARGDGKANVRVVAPARVSKLEWLATDEDEARAEAEVRALDAEWTLSDEAAVAGEGGDVDPVQAVDDALRDFSADEILVVSGPDENGGLEASLRRFGVPVSRVGGPLPLRRRDRVRESARRIAAGRSKATPFVFFAGVNLALLLLAVLIVLLVALVIWLL
jgi:hypothetical protein